MMKSQVIHIRPDPALLNLTKNEVTKFSYKNSESERNLPPPCLINPVTGELESISPIVGPALDLFVTSKEPPALDKERTTSAFRTSNRRSKLPENVRVSKLTVGKKAELLKSETNKMKTFTMSKKQIAARALVDLAEPGSTPEPIPECYPPPPKKKPGPKPGTKMPTPPQKRRQNMFTPGTLEPVVIKPVPVNSDGTEIVTKTFIPGIALNVEDMCRCENHLLYIPPRAHANLLKILRSLLDSIVPPYKTVPTLVPHQGYIFKEVPLFMLQHIQSILFDSRAHKLRVFKQMLRAQLATKKH